MLAKQGLRHVLLVTPAPRPRRDGGFLQIFLMHGAIRRSHSALEHGVQALAIPRLPLFPP